MLLLESILEGRRKVFLVPLALVITEILIIVFFIATLILQIILSRLKKPWPGLILPGLVFAVTVYMVIAFMKIDFNLASGLEDAGYYLMIFLNLNKPAGIYLLIYFLFRLLRRRKQRKSNISEKGETTI